MSRTVILGGGFGGLTVARTLRGLARDHGIVLVDKSPSFHVGATKTWVMLGERPAAEFLRPRETLLPRNVRVVRGEVSAIDAKAGRITTTAGSFDADFLVIALGAALNMNAIPGLAGAARTFYTMDGAERLRDELREFRGGHLVILIPRIPFQCPPAPYEAAMLLRERLHDTRLSVYTIEGAPMTTAGPEMGNFIKSELAKRNIAFHPLKKTTTVSSRRAEFEDGSSVEFDLLIAVPPHEAPRVVRDAGLVAESGWIAVHPETLRVKAISDRAVFAIGDVAGVPLPGRFKPDMPLSLPKAGTLAEAEGVAVATQIAAELRGSKAERLFDGRGFCYVELGESTAVKAEGEFFAQPNPVMRPSVPSREQLRDKREWVARWLGPYA